MQFPESWLREFCDPPSNAEEIAELLTMGGLEVESLVPAAPPFTGVVVGEITHADQHPNAERLRVCQVNIGSGAPLSIVCGAPNARVGIRVPCATVGAALPPGEDGRPFLIGQSELRGVDSQGMLCSARELKISEDHGGLLELGQDAPVGADVRKLLALDDMLFTLKLTPNLAHCLSVHGVARELAALSGAPLKSPRWPGVAVQHAQSLPVKISAPDLCGRFSGRIVRGVNPKAQTPQWMVDRLARCGQRSVTALVDISNYVMFEFGRPSHIFDLDKIHGGLDVRWGRKGESLKLLNGTTVDVDDGVGVIADERQVESLAGIMGGDATAVSDDTRNVYVEAAFWWPAAVAGRSRRYNFSTDAGHRFERGVDPSSTLEHIERISQLILEICGGQAGPLDDQQPNMPQAKPVALRVARAAKVIGMPLTQAECANALRRLGLAPQEQDGLLTVSPPSYRFDIQIEEDLIEEVARIHGFNNLPTTAPLAPIVARILPESRRSAFALRRAMASMGYQETINFSFVEERWEHDLAGNMDPIRLLNPIASQMNVMRSSLLGSLLQALKFNLDRRAERLRLFEIGRIYLRDARVKASNAQVANLRQPLMLAGLAYGPNEPLHWSGRGSSVDFFQIKGDVEALLAPRHASFERMEHPALHPGRCARILIDGLSVGVVGELHPKWRQSYELAQAPILFEIDMEALMQRPVPSAQPVAKHHPVQRDIAVVVREGVSHQELMQAIWAASSGGLLRDAVLFDLYRPEAATPSNAGQGAGAGPSPGEKSLAVRLTLYGRDATLSDEEIDGAVRAVVEHLISVVQARLRS